MVLRLYSSAFDASVQDSNSLADGNLVGKLKSSGSSYAMALCAAAFAWPVASDLTYSFLLAIDHIHTLLEIEREGILLPLATLPCARHCVRAFKERDSASDVISSVGVRAVDKEKT